MNIETVNELIASLESAGELSIREQKFLKLAKAFKQLAAENSYLASRKQQLIDIIRNADNDYCMCGDLMKSHVIGGCGHPIGMFDYHYNKWLEEEDATPATDRIVAGIKADGVEMFALMFAEEAIKDNNITTGWKARASRAASEYAELLREGAK
ncbi:hypothetical protein [Klebsiella pneumoniae]|uniref:hypothetical protein n=1 Tax=Klebsiella pneumoniae TaxID=573 RepID=UPI003463B68F